jgi:Tfp pilus assembly protein PilV
MRFEESNESGFSLIEVAIASFITMSSLVFLAGLFTLAMAQNRLVKQYSTSVALAQEKLEELNAVETSDKRLDVGGGLDDDTKQRDYYDTVYVDPDTGQVTNIIPEGVTPIYDRFWQIEADPSLEGTNAVIISVKVRSRQPSIGRTAEETTLATERSW